MAIFALIKQFSDLNGTPFFSLFVVLERGFLNFGASAYVYILPVDLKMKP